MAETQVTGRQIKDKSVFDLDIDLTMAPAHPTLVSTDRLVLVDPTDGNIKTTTFANLLTGLDSRYLRLSGGAITGNLVVSGTTTLNSITKVGTGVVANLNADLLDGYHASSFSPVSTATDKQIVYMNGSVLSGNAGLTFNSLSGAFNAGLGSDASAANCSAIGSNCISGDEGAVAIGYGSEAYGVGSVVIGSTCVSYENNSIVIGSEAYSYGVGGIAIGRGATANSENDIEIGSAAYNAKTSLYGAVNFPTLTATGFLKITAGLVSVHTDALGTVTSVGLSLPSIFTVTGSPVVSSGTLTAALASQTKNYVLVAPQFANGVPTFRKLTADDMPDLSAMYDNYYSWGIKLNSGTQFNILKYGATGYSNYYNGINFIAGNGVTLTPSSVSGGALGITIDSSATVSGNEFTMIGRNTTGYGVYSELTPSLIMRLISNNSGSDKCSFFDASGSWSRRDSFVTTGASNVTYTGQTLTDITGLAILLGANSTYEYEAILSVQTSAVTTGIQYAIAYTAGYSQFSGQIIGSVNTSYSRGNVLAINTASATFMTTSNQSGQILIKGYIKTSGIGGTLSIKHLKITSGTSTVLPYSYFRVNLISMQ